MSGAGVSTRRHSPVWLKLLLVLSLTANLLVIGVIAGYELRDDRRRGGGVGWLLDLVPEERRQLAEAHFAEARAMIEASDGDRGAQMDAVLAAIRAEPYEPAAVEAAMAAFGESRAKRWRVLRERLSTLLEQLTPAERAAFADNFEERVKRWQDRRRE